LIINNPFLNLVTFNYLLITDGFTFFIKILFLIATICCLLTSISYLIKEKISMYEYSILLLFATAGALCFVSSYDLLSVYLAIEIQSLSFYILTTLRINSSFSTEAGLKYFILGALASGFLLFGIAMIYGVTGTTNFELLSKLMIEYLNSSYLLNPFYIEGRLMLGILFLLTGFLFKITAVPFHSWAPDVYEGAPLPISTLFAVVPKIGIIAIMIKLFYFVFYDLIFIWQVVTLLCAILSIIVGTFSTLHQYKLKRFLAFSSITHIGFILIGFSTGTLEGLESVIFYLTIYVFMTLNAWLFISSFELNKKRFIYLSDLQFIGKLNPILGLTLILNLFSMAGVPPLAGFYAKVSIFISALDSSFYFIVGFALIFSVLSAFYYIRFVKILYFDESNYVYYFYEQIDYQKSIILGLTFLLFTFLFLKPNLMFLVIENMSLGLFDGLLLIFNNKKVLNKLKQLMVPGNIVFLFAVMGSVTLYYFNYSLIYRLVYLIVLFSINKLISYYYPQFENTGIMYNSNLFQQQMDQYHTIKRLNKNYLIAFYLGTVILILFSICCMFYGIDFNEIFGPSQMVLGMLFTFINGHEMYRLYTFIPPKYTRSTFGVESKVVPGAKTAIGVVAGLMSGYVGGEIFYLQHTDRPGPVFNQIFKYQTGVTDPSFTFEDKKQLKQAFYLKDHHHGLDMFLNHGELDVKTSNSLEKIISKNVSGEISDHQTKTLFKELETVSKDPYKVKNLTQNQWDAIVFGKNQLPYTPTEKK